MIVYKDQIKYSEAEIKLERHLEDDVVQNAKLFFGKDTIYIDAKRKIDSKSLGGTIPDGFLFDLSDKENPAFYIVEVELAKHDFYGHIFPQFTKFFGFFRISNSRGDLVDKLFGIVNNDDELKKEFKRHLQEKEIYKFIKDLVDDSQNILLIIDGEKPELPDVMDTYSDTWGKLVKIIILRKFVSGTSTIFTMEPEFENVDYSYVTKIVDASTSKTTDYSEDYHLKDTSGEVVKIYQTIKAESNKLNESAKFNARKYYIAISAGRNIAFFQFSKKKIRLVLMKDEASVREKITSHPVKHLAESVQKFWNGSCCEVELTKTENLDEVMSVLKELLTSSLN
jgi:predicted transport protein